MHNRILTKDNLSARGWVGEINCYFCHNIESRDHLFLCCALAQQVWFWLGKSQQVVGEWLSCNDIVQFSLKLSLIQRTGFLLVFSALCWTLWKREMQFVFKLPQVNLLE